ncbi:MAG TPA: hypothetical protein VFV50_15500 [Bdellovibrionales bacterium]|nr:hypothetical protein [Bdellovibrionales bacterium]
MNLNEIIRIHKNTKTPGSVKQCLGDGYLLARNPVYRRIRRWATAEGIKFRPNPPEQIYAFPTLSLGEYKRRRAIMVSDNIAHFRRLPKGLRDRFGFREVHSSYALQNRLLHESSHCLAHEHALKLRNAEPRDDRERAFNVLFEESLANATELLAFSYAADDLHFEFLLMNTYLAMERPPVERLIAIREKMGALPLFRMLVLLSLKTQFLEEAVPDTQLLKLARLFGPSSKRDLPVLRALLEIVKMHDVFKIKTARVYFLAQGFEKHFFHYLDFDYIEAFSRSPRANAILKKFEKELAGL